MHHTLIIKSTYFAGIAIICDAGAIKLSDVCSVRNLRLYLFKGVRGVVAMSDVNFNEYLCCLSIQFLDKNREWTDERICNILL